jgi:hypothetical protein
LVELSMVMVLSTVEDERHFSICFSQRANWKVNWQPIWISWWRYMHKAFTLWRLSHLL